MKRVLSVLLAAAMLLGMASCSNSKKDWQEQYDLGMRYLDEGDYEEAILAFTAAIEIDDSRPEAYMGRAEAYIAVNEPDKAMKDYKKAQKLAKQNNDEDLVEELEEIIVELEETIAAEETSGSETQLAEPVEQVSLVEIYDGEELNTSYEFSYNEEGLLEQVLVWEPEYDRTAIRLYTYDEENRLVYIDLGEYSFTQYEYDSEGRVVRYYHAEGGATDTSYEYDELGRLVREYSFVDTGDEEILYNYDDRGTCTGATIHYTNYYGDDSRTGSISYEYDLQNRLLASVETRDEYTCREEYTYYQDAVLMQASYEDGYSWAQVRLLGPSGEEQCTLHIWNGVADVKEENGRITEVTDTNGYSYRFTYTVREEKTTAKTDLGLWKPLEYEIIRQDRSYYDEDGIMRVEHFYDQVVLKGDSEQIAAINALITEDMNAFFDSNSEEGMLIYVEGLTGTDCYFVTAVARVTSNTGGIVSICISEQWYMGGVHNLDYYGMSFDVSTGEKVDLPALYGMTEAEMTALLKDTAWAYLSTYHAEDLWENSKETLYGYELEDFYYYFRDGELILTFPTYSFSYGAAGAFTVPTGLYY